MDGTSGIEIVRTVADLRGRVARLARRPARGSRWCRRWARCTRATWRWCATPAASPTGCASRCSSIPPSSARTRTTPIYPRDEAADAAKLTALGADLLFAPDVEEMYPEGAVTRVSVAGLGDVLEGEHRPGFFTGVATIVGKLLLQALPDVAVFGEKDYQQLLVIRRMVTDLWIPTRIEGVPTVREPDGLALSSRNAYLSRRASGGSRPRCTAPCDAVASGVASGADAVERAEWGEAELLRAGFDSVDYVAVRDAETLAAWQDPRRPGRVLAAARLGTHPPDRQRAAALRPPSSERTGGEAARGRSAARRPFRAEIRHRFRPGVPS